MNIRKAAYIGLALIVLASAGFGCVTKRKAYIDDQDKLMRQTIENYDRDTKGKQVITIEQPLLPDPYTLQQIK